MHLAPREILKLMLHQSGVVAQKRLDCGLCLSFPEALAQRGFRHEEEPS